ncbi:MAG: ABC transporter permease [Gemmataceae bacterium]
MRGYILKALVKKEWQRHLANRGGLAMILLLLVASVLLSVFSNRSTNQVGLLPGVQICYVDYAAPSPLIDHLKTHIPDELQSSLRFRSFNQVPRDAQGVLYYPQNTGAIQLRPAQRPGFSGTVWFWFPGANRGALAPYEVWFWKETLRFVQQQPTPTRDDSPPSLGLGLLEEQGFSLQGGLDPRSGLATSLVLFGVFFLCIYLLPSMTCEEHERGVLLAQALSPATSAELIGARFLFYPLLALLLAAILAGIYEPRVLLHPFFWCSLVVCVVGSVGIGMTIASLAQTQRAASMGAMCYLLGVSLLLMICQQNNLSALSYLAFEYHGPRLIHAALVGHIHWYHWGNLLGATILSLIWVGVAIRLFRTRGWQ